MTKEKELIRQITEQIEKSLGVFSYRQPKNSFYIQRLLNLFAEIEQNMGLKDATVSEHSLVGDFFLCWWQNDKLEEVRVLGELKSKLGFEVKFEDSLYEVAKKLNN